MIPRAKNADPVLESHLISHKKRIFFYCFFKLEWNGSCFFFTSPNSLMGPPLDVTLPHKLLNPKVLNIWNRK